MSGKKVPWASQLRADYWNSSWKENQLHPLAAILCRCNTLTGTEWMSSTRLHVRTLLIQLSWVVDRHPLQEPPILRSLFKWNVNYYYYYVLPHKPPVSWQTGGRPPLGPGGRLRTDPPQLFSLPPNFSPRPHQLLRRRAAAVQDREAAKTFSVL